MPPQTILFDLDGTLLDSIELVLNSKRHAFESRGLPVPSDADWLRWLGTPLVDSFAHYTTDAEEIRQFIRAYREYQVVHHDRLVRAYPGAHEALTALRAAGCPIGIVTSKSVQTASQGLQRVGLLEFADTIIGEDSTQRHKPDPEPVQLGLHRLQATAAHAMFVGDSIHDMAAGRAAGVTTVAALWGPFTRAELAPAQPTYYLERLADLPPLVARRA
ncbi:MAG TPA: HAD-IA family hydrolase [Gemmatimonadaceae bacterium]|jgi:pyrophosphatase PpaX|nr:HAD-IA family hydrolase [Gemmatimonadaceae bacterium]